MTQGEGTSVSDASKKCKITLLPLKGAGFGFFVFRDQGLALETFSCRD